MTVAFLLGAGFSKALSEAMPLMQELGPVVATALADRQLASSRPRAEDDIEVWLSYALEDQPFLSREHNLLNQAAGHAAIEALRDYVVRQQHAAEREGVPPWLDDLVTIWHGTRAEVITLNWDTLVEDAIDGLRLWSLAYPTHDLDNVPISSDDVLGRVPRLASGARASGPPGRITFNLWKLHGSVDWYWGEGDPHGETVVRRPLGRPTIGDRAGIAGKTPFFAAPTATKVSHYNNQIVRHVWRGARHAVEVADEIVLIGYSLPLTDLSVRSLLAGSATETVCVVDPAAAIVGERAAAVLIGGARVTAFDSVEAFVHAAAGRFMLHSARLVKQWTGRDDPAIAMMSNTHCGPITGMDRIEGGFELVASDWFDSLNVATSIHAPTPLRAGDIADALPDGALVAVRGPDGRRRLLYDVTLLKRDVGQSNRWAVLRCQA